MKPSNKSFRLFLFRYFLKIIIFFDRLGSNSDLSTILLDEKRGETFSISVIK